MSPAPQTLARDTVLDTLPAWRWHTGRDAICRDLVFRDFGEAMAFMVRVALVAEQQDHHPQWTNVYNTVNIVLWSHDVDGVTSRDVALATAIDRIAPPDRVP